MPPADRLAPRNVGRYTIHEPIASGGMATVYYGRASGAVGFSRVVAIKSMKPRLARDPQFRNMFIDEAQLASRVEHANVVSILDVVTDQDEILIVMEYVRGPSLAVLQTTAMRAKNPVPVGIAVGIACDVLAGLHAAHEARDTRGRPLGLVHRDVSPHNILVGDDGVARIMDFGVAKAAHRLSMETHEGQLKGKLSYMAPEQFRGDDVDRRADVFASAVVLWGLLAGRRLFQSDDLTETMSQVLGGPILPLATFRPDVPPALEEAIHRALERDREERTPTARSFADAIETSAQRASARVIGKWVLNLASELITEREAVVSAIESSDVTPADPRASSAPTRSAPRQHPEPNEPPTAVDRRKPKPIAEAEPAEPSMSSLPTLERIVAPPVEPTAETIVDVPVASESGMDAAPASRKVPAIAALVAGGALAVALAVVFGRSGDPPQTVSAAETGSAPVEAATPSTEPVSSGAVTPAVTEVLPKTDARASASAPEPRSTASTRRPTTTPVAQPLPRVKPSARTAVAPEPKAPPVATTGKVGEIPLTP